jgi:hypothetical protein
MCVDEPAVSWEFADVTAREEDGLIGEGGEKDAPQFVVFGGGDFGVDAVDDGNVPGGGGMHGNGETAIRLQKNGASIKFRL